jgi:hypothetical protein
VPFFRVNPTYPAEKSDKKVRITLTGRSGPFACQSQAGTHHCHPAGASGQAGSGCQPSGGYQPSGGVGQPGGTTNLIPVGAGGIGACRLPSAGAGETGAMPASAPEFAFTTAASAGMTVVSAISCCSRTSRAYA